MILDIHKVNVSFGGLQALNNCTCTIQKGRITAIIGPNGSGKSTLFNAISNLVPCDGGSIKFDHTNIVGMKEFKISRLGISRTFQDVRLFRNLTIRDHLHIALSTDDEHFWHGIFGRNKKNDDQEIHRILNLVRLHKALDTYATELSYGQRKLLDLAIALAKPHSLLMLDEPVAGVNPHLRKEIANIIRELKKQGETILLIEHDMNFVMPLADHVIVLDEGAVLVQGPPSKIKNDRRVLEAYLGE